MISKNKYKEEDQSSKENELFYKRIEESSRMSFIVFYISFNNKKQHQRKKKYERYACVNLRISGCQQPERIDNAKAEKEAAS